MAKVHTDSCYLNRRGVTGTNCAFAIASRAALLLLRGIFPVSTWLQFEVLCCSLHVRLHLVAPSPEVLLYHPYRQKIRPEKIHPLHLLRIHVTSRLLICTPAFVRAT